MNRLYPFLILLLLLGCEHPETKEYDRNQRNTTSVSLPDEFTKSHIANGFEVIAIKDGDTFVILIEGKEQVIRFAHIDCPEKKQPFGMKAKQFVSELCFGKFVTLIHKNEFDRNKRLIAEVILQDGTNLNQELIRNGLAWHYKAYSKDDNYAELELHARQNNIGLWADDEPKAPWVWRK